MDSPTARAMALDMPGTAEKERFRSPPALSRGYSVKKKTYLTLWSGEERAVLKLTLRQQAAFCEEHPDAFAPLQQKLGQHGWTNVYLAHVPERVFRYAVDLAWRNVAPKWLALTRGAPPKA